MNNNSRNQSLLQIFSNIAILLGLFFVGYELRYNTAATSAQALLELNVAAANSARWHYENGTIDILENNRDDPTTLSDSELSAVRTLIQLELDIAENAFMFHERGVLDEQSMMSYMSQRCVWITKNPVGAYLWEHNRFYLQPPFVSFLQDYCRDDT